MIHLGQLDPTDYRGAYSIYMDAFGNEELARKAQSIALKHYTDAEIAKHGNRNK